jgi:hypothetical protein
LRASSIVLAAFADIGAQLSSLRDQVEGSVDADTLTALNWIIHVVSASGTDREAFVEEVSFRLLDRVGGARYDHVRRSFPWLRLPGRRTVISHRDRVYSARDHIDLFHTQVVTLAARLVDQHPLINPTVVNIIARSFVCFIDCSAILASATTSRVGYSRVVGAVEPIIGNEALQPQQSSTETTASMLTALNWIIHVVSASGTDREAFVEEVSFRLLDRVGGARYDHVRRSFPWLRLPGRRTVISRRDRVYSARDHIDLFHTQVVTLAARLVDQHPLINPTVVNIIARSFVCFIDCSAILASATTSRVGYSRVVGAVEPIIGNEALQPQQSSTETTASMLSHEMCVATLQNPFLPRLRAPILAQAVSASGSSGAMFVHVLGSVLRRCAEFGLRVHAIGFDAAAHQLRAAEMLGDTLGALWLCDGGHLVKRLFSVGSKAFSIKPLSSALVAGELPTSVVVERQMLAAAVTANGPFVPNQSLSRALQQPTNSFALMSMANPTRRFSSTVLAAIRSTLLLANVDAKTKWPAEYQFYECVTDFRVVIHETNHTPESWPKCKEQVERFGAFFSQIKENWSGDVQTDDKALEPRRGLADDCVTVARQYVALVDSLFEFVKGVNESCGAIGDAQWKPRVHSLALVQGFLESFFGRSRGGRGGGAATLAATHFAMEREIRYITASREHVYLERSKSIAKKKKTADAVEAAIESKVKRRTVQVLQADDEDTDDDE